MGTSPAVNVRRGGEIAFGAGVVALAAGLLFLAFARLTTPIVPADLSVAVVAASPTRAAIRRTPIASGRKNAVARRVGVATLPLRPRRAARPAPPPRASTIVVRKPSTASSVAVRVLPKRAHVDLPRASIVAIVAKAHHSEGMVASRRPVAPKRGTISAVAAGRKAAVKKRPAKPTYDPTPEPPIGYEAEPALLRVPAPVAGETETP